MRPLLLRLVVNAAALVAADFLIDGVHLNGGPLTALWVALLLGVVNTFVRPVLLLLSLPAVLLTLGLFAWVVNAAALGLTAAFTGGLDIDGFWSALGGSLVIAGVNALLGRYVDGRPAPVR